MENEEVKQELQQASSETALVPNTAKLDQESLELLNKIVEETDLDKSKDLTYLFNQNQNKKTMVRMNKLNELMDVITDQAITRFSERPDNISNQELLTGLKVVQDIIERGQKQIAGAQEQPLIQINQQTNEVNVGAPENMPKESRDRIKNAVMDFLGNIQQATKQPEIIDATVEEKKDGN